MNTNEIINEILGLNLILDNTKIETEKYTLKSTTKHGKTNIKIQRK